MFLGGNVGLGPSLPLQLSLQPLAGPSSWEECCRALPVPAAPRANGGEDWEGLSAERHLVSAAIRRDTGRACSDPAGRGADDFTLVYRSGCAFLLFLLF